MLTDFSCKFCGSNEVVKYGKQGGVQYWWCKQCQRKFADNDALPDMKTPIHQISSALSMYYCGMSIDEIRLHLDQEHNYKPSDSTIYEWIQKFSIKANDYIEQYHPQVGDVWIADETVLDLGGKKVWFWDLIDTKTRFILASHLSYNRTSQHAQALVEKAVKRAGKSPKVILTDKLAAYLDGIENVLGSDTEHLQSKGFSSEQNTNMIERFHGSLKSRTKVMRGLKTPESALTILDGWLVHYNYFRPHESLKGITPASKAGIIYPVHNWLDVVNYSHPAKEKLIIFKPDFKARELTASNIGYPTRYGLKRKNKRKGVIKKLRKQTPVINVPPISTTCVSFIRTNKSR
jgi:transposase-like protein